MPYKDKADKKENASKWREQNTDYHKEWKKDNPNYHRDYDRKRRKRWKTIIDDIKVHYGCMNPSCAWKSPYTAIVLDFHHIDRISKRIGLAGGIKSSKATLINEIRKCCVLCACCHRLETAGLLDTTDIEPCKIDDNGNVLE